MKYARLLLSLLVCFTFLFGQTAKADNVNLKIQLAKARNLMAGGDYYGAIRILRELEKSHPDNEQVFYRSGQCYFQLKNYDDALVSLEKSVNIDSTQNIEKFYYLGLSFQIKGKLEEAEKSLNSFLAKEKSKNDRVEDAKKKVKQIAFARQCMSKPMNVLIKNLGEEINSEYPEYNPSISADGNIMIFTSRRPDTKGGMKDENDNKFMEDIYIAYRDTESGKWQTAERVPGGLNTENHDANTSISPDGKTIFIYRNMDYKGSGQIFYSKMGGKGMWSVAKLVEGDVNTSYFESSACVSPDGRYLYFVSERKGGKGMGDIYRAKGKKTTFKNAESLGDVINTEDDEIGIFLHPDGKTIYFSSNGHESMGGYDIFKSTLVNGKWTKPENLGYPINTPGDERFFVLSTDGTKAYYTSTGKEGFGDLDIYEVDFTPLMKAEAELKTTSGPPISLLNGQVVDKNTTQLADCEIIVSAKKTENTFTTTTDESGNFFLSLEGNADYILVIKKTGFKEFKEEFHLKASDSGTFKLNRVVVLEKL